MLIAPVVFILIALVFIGVRFLFKKAGIYLPNVLFKILLGIQLCLLLLSVSAFILSEYNIYWRGYRSTSIIIITTAITGLLCFWLYKGKSFVPFAFVVFVETFIAAILVFDMDGSYTESRYYDNNKFRLENTDRFIMGHPCLPDLFVKEGLFEKKYKLNRMYPPYILSISQIKKVHITEVGERKVRITFTHSADTIKGFKNPLIVDIDLNK
jgi:hypothetical protein